MSNIVEKAKKLRATIEGLAVNLDDSSALENKELFPSWKAGVEHKTGDRIRYEGVLYSVLQNHTSQADWTPSDAASLFARVLIPDPEVITEWVQPDSTNPYMKGDKVMFEGSVYESLIDNNVWSPAAYPAGWQKI